LISEDFDFSTFLASLKDKTPLEVVDTADTEALDAWRRTSSAPQDAEKDQTRGRQYVRALKELIRSIRYTVKLPCTDEDCCQSRIFAETLLKRRFADGRWRSRQDTPRA
jgi:hypothetical protein